MIDEQRKADIKSRIAVLSEELRPLAARVKNLKERIASLELDLRSVLDEQHVRVMYQKPQRDVRELR
jgi:chromosome segregation ATPase